MWCPQRTKPRVEWLFVFVEHTIGRWLLNNSYISLVAHAATTADSWRAFAFDGELDSTVAIHFKERQKDHICTTLLLWQLIYFLMYGNMALASDTHTFFTLLVFFSFLSSLLLWNFCINGPLIIYFQAYLLTCSGNLTEMTGTRDDSCDLTNFFSNFFQIFCLPLLTYFSSLFPFGI